MSRQVRYGEHAAPLVKCEIIRPAERADTHGRGEHIEEGLPLSSSLVLHMRLLIRTKLILVRL